MFTGDPVIIRGSWLESIPRRLVSPRGVLMFMFLIKMICLSFKDAVVFLPIVDAILGGDISGYYGDDSI